MKDLMDVRIPPAVNPAILNRRGVQSPSLHGALILGDAHGFPRRRTAGSTVAGSSESGWINRDE